ncbi:uncharacterized protein BP5553_09267 [Venustampulla echinocandica]|uniref:Uncharacterized protein n=1 Tax=Venustampulla echinocandica TaxID=2656787 RepID=A0A370TC99_9HELO|nr:uncharacterized protein BP5553_09267 [Venustampulla echinocandica]RDL31865.1 hypothetical protein BP5553_09267 [Venustampulla echinocandica]
MNNQNVSKKITNWAFNRLVGVFAPKGRFPEPLQEDWVVVGDPKTTNCTDGDWVVEEEPPDEIISTCDEPQRSDTKVTRSRQPKHSPKTRMTKRAKSIAALLQRAEDKFLKRRLSAGSSPSRLPSVPGWSGLASAMSPYMDSWVEINNGYYAAPSSGIENVRSPILGVDRKEAMFCL